MKTKRLSALILAVIMLISCAPAVFALQSNDVISIDDVSAEIKKEVKPLKEKDWTICIYMCGTDLETKNGCATNDIIEMLSAKIPNNITLLVMTGGTATWNPANADAAAVEKGLIKKGAYLKPDSEKTQIYRIDDDKMNLVYTYDENFDMGDVCTLEKFMEFALYYAPSRQMMLSMWNHGGGPMTGVEVDEYTKNVISVPQYTNLVEALYNARDKRIDILGFDTCLIGNYEIAYNLAPFADYMVASAEIEPGSGWNYKWLEVFDKANNGGKAPTPYDIGKRIIDTYPANENADWSITSSLTLALYDLSQADRLAEAFDDMADELYASLSDPELYADIARSAEKVMNMYTGTEGLLDLYDFSTTMKDLLPSAQNVLDTLGTLPEENPCIGDIGGEDTFVLYRGASPNYNKGISLTFYYPTSKTTIYDRMKAEETAFVYDSLEMSESYSNFIREVLYRTDKLQYFQGTPLLYYDYENDTFMVSTENPDDTLSLKRVDYTLTYTKKLEDGGEITYDLGSEPAIADWDNSTFTIPFDGTWFSIDGEYFTCEKSPGFGYDMYYAPIQLEGSEDLSLMQMYVFPESKDMAIIASIIDIDYAGVSNRSIAPDENLKFRTVLLEENEYGSNYRYLTYSANNTVITPEVITIQNSPQYAVKLEYDKLESDEDAVYQIQGRAIDMKNNVFYTNPMSLYISNDIESFSIEPIKPQIYTGSPVTPKIQMLYRDTEILLPSSFDIRYENNTEIGTARVIAAIDDEDMQGEVVCEFEIKNASDIYSDVTNDVWYLNDLAFTQSLNPDMWDDNMLYPGKPLTRGEFSQLLYEYATPSSVYTNLPFTDVSADSPFYKAIKWANDAGVVLGITDKTFAPDKKITRSEMLVMLKRYDEDTNSPHTETTSDTHFADCSQIPLWAKDAIHWAAANGILKGNAGNAMPESFVTRSEAMAIISRYAN